MATTIASARTKRRHGSIGLRQAWALLLSIETPDGAFAMNTKNHSETANSIFQVLTIAAIALFSIMAVLHTAALIV
jgi:hypothetical protein